MDEEIRSILITDVCDAIKAYRRALRKGCITQSEAEDMLTEIDRRKSALRWLTRDRMPTPHADRLIAELVRDPRWGAG